MFVHIDPPPTNEAEQSLFEDNLNMIFNLFNADKYDDLAKYMKLLPDTGDITPLCTSLAIATLNARKQRECILGQVIDQTRQFLNTLPGHKPTLAGKSRKVLNTQIDYKTYLQQNQISEILGIVQDQEFTMYTIADNLKKQFDESLDNRFQGLKSYFSQVEDFNQKIAKADIGYIKGTLDTYKNQVTSLSEEAGENYVDLLRYALSIATVSLAESIAKVGMRIFGAMNPASALFGSGVVDVMEALAEMALAISELANAITLIEAFDTLQEKTGKVVEKLGANNDFLEDVKEIIDKIDADDTSSERFEELKQRFLTKYNDYSPQVTKPELTEMASYWETVIDELCGVIDGATTPVAAGIQAAVKSQGLCWKIPIKVQKLIELFAEIFDFQFDLMDALADYVRASTAVNAAGDMLTNFNQIADSDPERILVFLQQLACMTFLTNKMQNKQIINSYCEVLEYKQGGHPPEVCTKDTISISSLVAHVTPAINCELTYQNIPTIPSDSTDRAYLNLTELFRGAPVTFQIPNHQWLKNQAWISPGDQSSAIYLKRFEVYLPTESPDPRAIDVVSKSTGGNMLDPTSTNEYLITPPKRLEYNYYEGRNIVCRQDTITNPYKLCEEDAPPEICPRTKLDECVEQPVTALDLSVYTQWSIQLTGYPTKQAIPEPATPVSVKVGVDLCKLPPSTGGKSRDVQTQKKHGKKKAMTNDSKKRKTKHGWKMHWSKKLMRDDRCCGDGQFWSEADSSCQSCPESSVRRLRGYYCDKNAATNP